MIYRIILYKEEMIVTKEDYIALIEISDDYEKLDSALKAITGVGHGSGTFTNLDNLYEVLLRNANECYSKDGEEAEFLFYCLLEDTRRSPEERADILMNGTVRYYG